MSTSEANETSGTAAAAAAVAAASDDGKRSSRSGGGGGVLSVVPALGEAAVSLVSGGVSGGGDKDRKIGHRRVDDQGKVSYKKVQSNQLMKAIQLGVEYSVGAMGKYDDRDLLMQDFMTVETHYFPKNGSTQTPAHNCSDFTFRAVAPLAFRYFLNLFGIQREDFLMSMCNEPLRELSNPGASGSLFYLTGDDEFILKTVMHKEAEFLQKLLPGYYMNLNQNPHTLLPKFFGMFCYQCNQKNIRLIVMNNLLPSDVKMHLKFDLKGSTYKRKASKRERAKASPTFKDLDFLELLPEGLLLEQETYNALITTMRRDCRVLESFRIMDYSLLIGIHNLDQAAKEREESGSKSGTSPASRGGKYFGVSGVVKQSNALSGNKPKLLHSTAMEAIQAQTEPIDDQDHVPPGGIPARNHKGERLLLFLGIIDILQSYRMRKKLEHTLKSIIHDGDTVSVHRPGFYAHRFLDFMADRVFKKVPSPLKHSPSKRSSKKDSIKKDRSAAAATAAAAAAAAAASSSASASAATATAVAAATSSGTEKNQETGIQRPDVVPGGGGVVTGHRSNSGSRPSSAAASRLRQSNGRQNSQSSADGVSVNDVRLEARYYYSMSNHGTPSHLSVGAATTSGWNTPTATPNTWTEGTPSYTESSTFSEENLSASAVANAPHAGQSSDDLRFDETLQVEV